MRLAINGTELWFDVEGTGLVAEGPPMRHASQQQRGSSALGCSRADGHSLGGAAEVG
jgi:hypothetical protein